MKERLLSISILRLLSTLCIFAFHLVLTHFDAGKRFFPLYFAVQIFLFISGYLYSDKKIKDVKSFYIKNTLKILLPVVVFGLIFLAVVGVCRIFSVNIPIMVGTPNRPPQNTFGHLWFLYAILICYAITPMLQYVLDYRNDRENPSKNFRVQLFEIIIILACAINIFSMCSGGQSILLPYIVGYFFKRVQLRKSFNSMKLTLSLGSTIVFIFALMGYGVCFTYATTPTMLEGFVREVLCAVMAITFTIVFLIAFEKLKVKKVPLLFRISDKYSYSFFIVHNFFVAGSFMPFILGVMPFEWFVVVAFACSCIGAFIIENLSQLILKPINKKLDRKFRVVK